MKKIVLLIFCLCVALIALSQSYGTSDSVARNSNSSGVNQASQKVVSSFSKGKDDDSLAEDYYQLALQLIATKDYKKAEIYLQKAVELASRNKKGNERLSYYYRELAKVQELLNKDEEASENFRKASLYTDDQTQKRINNNDAGRSKSKSDPETEMQYLNQNAYFLSNSNGNERDIVQTYNQMAEINRSNNNPNDAITNYKDALNSIDGNSTDAILIQSEMADLYAETKNYTEAINLQKQVVEKSYQNADVEVQVKQMRQLSDIYFAAKNEEEGLDILISAYKLALEKGNVKEARLSLIALTNYYEKTKNSEKILELYRDFITSLDTLISRDSSLIDVKLFEITEEKIIRLEKEKQLQDELISRKNNYNLMLGGSLILLILLTLIIVWAWNSVKKRNKQIALQSLRREMNPHFVFNSLNSVNQFIASNNELEANKYLSSYSNLMRRFMENSNNDFVSLSSEIDQLSKYLELEKLRFPDKFDYTISVDDELDSDLVKIPNMIIQPNCENAIWHGLRYRETKGHLNLSFTKSGTHTIVIIEDNGIGLEASASMKTKNQKLHESRGLTNVKERIKLINDIYKSKINMEIIEKTGDETGVIVKIAW
ncbi:MAG: histidine kinase [Bacteroidales bacterium]|nr:histidine kinase [Bacteroidales bacterium]